MGIIRIVDVFVQSDHATVIRHCVQKKLNSWAEQARDFRTTYNLNYCTVRQKKHIIRQINNQECLSCLPAASDSFAGSASKGFLCQQSKHILIFDGGI